MSNFIDKMTESFQEMLKSSAERIKHDIANKEQLALEVEQEEVVWAKSVADDPIFSLRVQGYDEKTARLTNEYLRQISISDSIISSVIVTRQNQVSNYARIVSNKRERGARIILKKDVEKKMLKIIMERIREEEKKDFGVRVS